MTSYYLWLVLVLVVMPVVGSWLVRKVGGGL